jgi:hypothetical protein
MGPLTRAIAGLLGAAIFGAGVTAVFTTSNGTGSAALVAIGAVFVAEMIVFDRESRLTKGECAEVATVINGALRSSRLRVSTTASQDSDRKVIGERILEKLNAHR